ncbi:MAG: ArnT family glycosyltransferase, partial [Thiohalomonadales bacterium]
SYHPDEWIVTIWATQLYAGTILDSQFEYGGTLYLSFIYFGIKISTFISDFLPGYNAFANGLIVTRGLLVVVSLLTVYLTYAIGDKLYNRYTGLLAALFLSVTPGHVIWAQRVRVDELAAFMATLIFYLSIKVYQQHSLSRRYWALLGVCVGAAIALRAPLLLFAAAPVIAWWLSAAKTSELFSKDHLKCLSIYTISIIFAYFSFSPHSLLYFDHFINGLLLQQKYQSIVFVESVGLGPIGWQYIRYMLPQALGWPFYLLMLSALIWLLRYREKRALFVALTALPYLLLTAVGSWVVVRYTIPLLPFIALLCAAFIYFLQSNTGFKKGVIPAGVTVVVVTLSFLLPYQELHTRKNVREEVHDWMSKNIAPGSSVLTLRPFKKDVFSEPIIPVSLKRGFVKYPEQMQCDRCYEAWIYDYIVVSDPLLGNIERLQSDYPHAEMIKFYSWLKSSHELVKEFADSPYWFGINIQGMYSAHDLNYVSPNYRLYRKKEM